MPISPARTVAFDTLKDVAGGAHASDLLRTRSASLEPRDAGLASELALGVLRRQSQLDFLAGLFSGRDAGQLDLEVRIILRLGIYQLRYLDRIPRHAAVSESVELVKRARKRSAAGFVNAVLRKVDQRVVEWPSEAVELCQPEWLLESWRGQFGRETASGIARAFLDSPAAYIRVPADRRSETEGLGLEATDIPGCYRASGEAPEGFRRQDIGSQAIVPLLGLEPGARFLDLCAAPGNKTAQALETPVHAVAADISLPRLSGLRDLGAPLVRLDGAGPLPFGQRFDSILVDAPCSGTGTIGRNPEIRWRIQPPDLERHQKRQVRLLRHAVEALASGGRLVYSTCSLQEEENGRVVAGFLADGPSGVTLVREVRRTPGLDPGDGFYAAVFVRT